VSVMNLVAQRSAATVWEAATHETPPPVTPRLRRAMTADLRSPATLIARLHVADGVTIVIDDVCVPAHFEDHYVDLFAEPRVHRVMLKPTWAALETRMRARAGPWDELLLSSGAARWCYEGLEHLTLKDWVVVDSSDQSAEETAEEVRTALARSSIAPRE